MSAASKDSATWTVVGAEGDSQRIDNYLLRRLKGVPKSHVYRILRSGEVRVNSRRVDASYRLHADDRLRLPPIRTPDAQTALPRLPDAALAPHILYEDDALLALDKPAGVAVHGGSGIALGAIEQLRRELPETRFLELAHRLDRDTSGVLLLAKKRSALLKLHAALREGRTEKHYMTLAAGRFRDLRRSVKLPLHKFINAAGERRVVVSDEGQGAHTVFLLREVLPPIERTLPPMSLLEAELKTGRTHQIRVHLAHLGHPVLGDDKYGDFALNRALARHGLRRMFLHAESLALLHPETGERIKFTAPLPQELARFLAVARGND